MPPTQFSLLAGPVGQKGEPGPSVSTYGLLRVWRFVWKMTIQVIFLFSWLAFGANKDGDGDRPHSQAKTFGEHVN